MSPSEKPTRREFLVTSSSVALGAAIPLGGTPTADEIAGDSQGKTDGYSSEDLVRPGVQRTFTREAATLVAMPVGGIGAGCVCFNGYGGLQDFSIWNHPTTTALPEGFAASKAGFAILHVKKPSAVTKLIEGPFPVLKIFDQGLQGEGYRRGGFEGFPRFQKCEFKGEFPFGEAQISDASVPVQVTVTSWNPFIPLDDKNSGIPCAILEYTFHNASKQAVEFEFSYHLSHLASGCGNDDVKSRNTALPGRGVFFHNMEESNSEAYGSACLMAIGERTKAFKDALFASSVPPYVLDAISANLAIMKSPTVLRLENGDIWGWEGCFPDEGCCHGSCTHVWNYAQAFPHLFPKLERSLRELELVRSMNEEGHVTFRSALPEGAVPHDFHAASDGQLGGILKVSRDWQISGDSEWLEKMYPLAKRSLDYCIRTWDPDHRGGLFEPHHNTYDIEFWGPDGMCTSIYLGALSALAEMANAVGQAAEAVYYDELAHACARFMEEQLFNGEYFQQKVQYQGLRNTSFATMIAQVDDRSSEMQQLLKREGPKYQYGNGCLSDGVIGAWMARIYGIDTPLAQDKVRKTLQAIFKHNFKTDLSQHANAQRPGYAMGHEPGLLLCTWPLGGKPTLPFVYSDEVWTGIEYQVASHLIAEGLVKEGLTIVKALRSRYDGWIRNPWNEYECGNYYARAMASYALLGALAGLRYSPVQRTLRYVPQLSVRPFKTFFCTASGFGTIALDARSLRVQMLEGELLLEKLVLADGAQSKTLEWKTTVRPDAPAIKPV